MTKLKFFAYSLLVVPFVIFAQDDTTDTSNSEVEEVVVVGSQIKGASITDALPVTVLSADDIEALGVGDGDELIEQEVKQSLLSNIENLNKIPLERLLERRYLRLTEIGK